MSYKLTEGQCEEVVRRGAQALADYCIKNEIHYVVTGSSGGLDSAVTLGFAQRACQMAGERDFELTLVGLIMPCESNPEAERLGRKAIQTFGAEEIRLDLSSVFQFATGSLDWADFFWVSGGPLHESLQQIISRVSTSLVSTIDDQIQEILKKTGGQQALESWDWSKKIAQGNIRARLRMMFGTYHVARMMKGMVLSTDNLSEFWMAFWTICGDVGDFGVIQQALKGLELYDIARYIGVPQEIIDARPDDGLGVAGGDEDQLGASYPVLDRVMIRLIQQGFDPDGSLSQLDRLPEIEGVDPEIVHKLARRCICGSFKRQGTIILSREELGLPSIQEIKLD